MFGPPRQPRETALPDHVPRHRTHVGLQQRVLARLQRCQLPPSAGVTVGFSGGPDSLALAALLARISRVGGIQVSLVHVDHGLRPTSNNDALTCARIAEALCLPLSVVRLPARLRERHPGVGVEEAARRERYVALAREAARLGSAIVAVAHHLDDQAETVLLHLLRGAGLSGAAAMGEMSRLTVPWWETHDDEEPRSLIVWRPFLQERRAIVRAYATATGLAPIEDETNRDPRFRRNRIRREVLPLLERVSPGASAALARFARIASDEDALLADIATQALTAIPKRGRAVDARSLAELPPAIRRRVILAWLRELGLHDTVPLDRIEALADAAERRRGTCQIELGGGWTAIVTGGGLSLRGPAARTGDISGPSCNDKGGNVTTEEPKALGIARILIGEDQIQQKVRELAHELDEIYRDDPPLMVGVLTGAVTFMTDLMRAMSIPVTLDFMAVSSYGASTESSGVVRILKDLNENVEGRRLLIVEDIVDSGLTLQYLIDVLRRRNPADIRVVALLRKEKERAAEVQVDQIGFSIPDEFVVGYGLDYAGRYRNLPYVAVLDERVISGA
jgi:tRNA(Ile)-lysidine synthase